MRIIRPNQQQIQHNQFPTGNNDVVFSLLEAELYASIKYTLQETFYRLDNLNSAIDNGIENLRLKYLCYEVGEVHQYDHLGEVISRVRQLIGVHDISYFLSLTKDPEIHVVVSEQANDFLLRVLQHDIQTVIKKATPEEFTYELKLICNGKYLNIQKEAF